MAAATTTITVDITTGSSATITSGFTTTTTATAIPAARTAPTIRVGEVTRLITIPTIAITGNLSMVATGALHIIKKIDPAVASGAGPGKCRSHTSRTASVPLRILGLTPPVPVPAASRPSLILQPRKSHAHHLLHPVLQETGRRDHQGLPLPLDQVRLPRQKRPQAIRVHLQKLHLQKLHLQKLHLQNRSAKTGLPARSPSRFFFPPLSVLP